MILWYHRAYVKYVKLAAPLAISWLKKMVFLAHGSHYQNLTDWHYAFLLFPGVPLSKNESAWAI